MSTGLRVGQTPVLTSECAWTLDWYEVNPVFVARPSSDFLGVMAGGQWVGYARIEVDVDGMPLVCDLASLVDMGGRVREGCIAWTSKQAIPTDLRQFSTSWHALEIEFLLDPFMDMCRAAIAVTGCAALLTDVPASRLTLLHAPLPSPSPNHSPGSAFR